MANGMTLGEIIAEISERIKLNLSEASIVRKVNNLQQEIFRKYYKIATVTKMDLQKGYSLYQSPCPVSSIIEVLVDGVKYEFRSLLDRDEDYFFYSVNNDIGIFPAPEKNVVDGLLIFHYKAPTKLTVSDMDTYPALDSDFHILLVFGVLLDLIEDQNKAAKYSALYNALLKDLQNLNGSVLPSVIRVE